MAIGDLFNNVNIFGAGLPAGSEGLLTEEQQKQLANQSLVQGLLGTAASYIAQPKTGRYGSALPYLGKAFLGGMQTSQGAYDTALNRAFQAKALEQRGQKTMTIDRGDAIDILNEKGETIRSVPKGLAPTIQKPEFERFDTGTQYEIRDKATGQIQYTVPKVKEQKNLYNPTAVKDANTGQLVYTPTVEGLDAGVAPRNAMTGEVVTGFVPAPEKEKQEFQKQSTSLNNLEEGLKKYKETFSRTGTRLLTGAWSKDARADYTELQTKYKDIMLQAKEAYNLGVLNGPDLTILESILLDPTSIKGKYLGDKAVMQNIDDFFQIIDRNRKSLSTVYGTPVRTSNQEGSTQPKTMTPPKVGAVMNGFKFKGGDPSKQENWEKI